MKKGWRVKRIGCLQSLWDRNLTIVSASRQDRLENAKIIITLRFSLSPEGDLFGLKKGLGGETLGDWDENRRGNENEC